MYGFQTNTSIRIVGLRVMTFSPEICDFQKKSVSLHGHKTSVSLEKAFWDILLKAANSQNISLSQLIKTIDDNRKGNLASALRIYTLNYVLNSK